MNTTIQGRIAALPPLPKSVIRIQHLCRDPEATLSGIAAVLVEDPMLTSNTLKVANSPLYGLSGRIASVQHAVTMLGKSMVRGLVVGASLRHALAMDMRPYSITNGAFAHLATMQSAVAFHWLVHERSHDLDLIITASFVMELGKILVADAILRADLLVPFRQAVAASADIEAVEREHVGVDSYALAASMFEHWHFDPELVAAVRHLSDLDSADPRHRRLALTLRAVATCASVRSQFAAADVERASNVVLALGGDLEGFRGAVAMVASAQAGDARSRQG